MDFSFRQIGGPLSLAVLFIVIFCGCNSSEDSKPTHILTLADDNGKEKKLIWRPGTSRVTIMPPQKSPVVFEWISGGPIVFKDIAELSVAIITVELYIPYNSELVTVVDVDAGDPGIENDVRRIISGWRYSPSMTGTLYLVIRPLAGVIDENTRELKKTGPIKPKIGVPYYAQ